MVYLLHTTWYIFLLREKCITSGARAWNFSFFCMYLILWPPHINFFFPITSPRFIVCGNEFLYDITPSPQIRFHTKYTFNIFCHSFMYKIVLKKLDDTINTCRFLLLSTSTQLLWLMRQSSEKNISICRRGPKSWC